MDMVDRRAPLYAQVKARLTARITDGTLQEGDFLPPEPELCEEMGVSRITLRRAVKELVDDGMLIRQQGRGTIVARGKVRQTLVSLSGFAEAFRDAGPVTHDILSVAEAVRDPAAMAALGGRVRPARVERLISVDGRPFTLERLYLDPDTLPGVFGPVCAGASFFDTLRAAGGPVPVAAERVINVGFADPAERRQLKVGPTQPVYRIDKTVLDADDSPIAFSHLVTPTHLITYAMRS